MGGKHVPSSMRRAGRAGPSEGLVWACILLVFCLPRGQAAPAELSGALGASRLRGRPQRARTTQQKVILTLDNNEVFLCLTTSMCSLCFSFGKALKSIGPIPLSRGARVTICPCSAAAWGGCSGDSCSCPRGQRTPQAAREEGGWECKPGAVAVRGKERADGGKGGEACGNGRRMSCTPVLQQGKAWAQPGRLGDPQRGQGAGKGLRAVPRAAVSPEGSQAAAKPAGCRSGLLAPAGAPSPQPPCDTA